MRRVPEVRLAEESGALRRADPKLLYTRTSNSPFGVCHLRDKWLVELSQRQWCGVGDAKVVNKGHKEARRQ